MAIPILAATVRPERAAVCALSYIHAFEINDVRLRALNQRAYVAMATAMQTAVCNQAHLLEARLARWLLMTRDRAASDRFSCSAAN